MKIYILLLTFIISVGCSSQKKGKLIKTVKKETKALVSGPRNTSNNTMFFDASDKYGLEGVQATHLYSVNLNNDFYNDLVYLPSFYSIPVFCTPITKFMRKFKFSSSDLPFQFSGLSNKLVSP